MFAKIRSTRFRLYCARERIRARNHSNNTQTQTHHSYLCNRSFPGLFSSQFLRYISDIENRIEISVTPRYVSSFASSFRLLNFVPLLMKFPQVWQQMLIGSIIRTLIWPSAGRFPRGTFAGSKSGGMYLLRTLRSPIFYVYLFVLSSFTS